MLLLDVGNNVTLVRYIMSIARQREIVCSRLRIVSLSCTAAFSKREFFFGCESVYQGVLKWKLFIDNIESQDLTNFWKNHTENY